MRIGSEYRVDAITARHWERLAERNGLDFGWLTGRIDEMVRRLPDAFREAAATAAVQALRSGLPERLVTSVEEHAKRCRAAMGR